MQPRQGRINHQNNSLIHLGPFSSRQRQPSGYAFIAGAGGFLLGLGFLSRFREKSSNL